MPKKPVESRVATLSTALDLAKEEIKKRDRLIFALKQELKMTMEINKMISIKERGAS